MLPAPGYEVRNFKPWGSCTLQWLFPKQTLTVNGPFHITSD